MGAGWVIALWLAQRPLCPGVEPLQVIYQVRPVYPKLALAARIQGTVQLAARIDRQGKVAHLRLISGHPFLVEAAIDAVKQWRYRPLRSCGEPVEVVTQIDVPFTISTGLGEVIWVYDPNHATAVRDAGGSGGSRVRRADPQA